MAVFVGSRMSCAEPEDEQAYGDNLTQITITHERTPGAGITFSASAESLGIGALGFYECCFAILKID